MRFFPNSHKHTRGDRRGSDHDDDGDGDGDDDRDEPEAGEGEEGGCSR